MSETLRFSYVVSHSLPLPTCWSHIITVLLMFVSPLVSSHPWLFSVSCLVLSCLLPLFKKKTIVAIHIHLVINHRLSIKNFLHSTNFLQDTFHLSTSLEQIPNLPLQLPLHPQPQQQLQWVSKTWWWAYDLPSSAAAIIMGRGTSLKLWVLQFSEYSIRDGRLAIQAAHILTTRRVYRRTFVEGHWPCRACPRNSKLFSVFQYSSNGSFR